MSLRDIKKTIERLCYDLQDEYPEDYNKRVSEIHQMVIHDPQWLEKNAHFRLKACQALWKANSRMEDHLEDRWQVNRADGWLEEAIKIDVAERIKGIPKPLQRIAQAEEGTQKWIDALQESDEFYITSEALYDRYKAWMEDEAPDDEILNPNALGQRIGKDGLQRTTKKIEGKAVKVWKVLVPE